MNTIPQIICDIQNKYPDLNAQYYRESKSSPFVSRTFAEFYQDSLNFGAGLLSLGLKKAEPVGLFSDNRREWGVADIGIQACGSADVPRGRDITDGEITIIFGITECRYIVAERDVEVQRLFKAKADLPKLTTIIAIEEQKENVDVTGLSIISFAELIELGKKYRAKNPSEIETLVEHGKRENIATIIFTSGTTGKPKGVPLTQANYLLHVTGGKERMKTEPGDIWLTMLPVWHSFERSVQYIALGNGVGLAYSKPVGSIMMKDFAEINPHYTTAVPRIWEAVYKTIQQKMAAASFIKRGLFGFFVRVGGVYARLDNLYKGLAPRFKKRNRTLDKIFSALPRLLLMPINSLGHTVILKPIRNLFGTRLKAAVSGGGSLEKKIDLFFAAAGICLMEGYGLTESGPVIAVRNLSHLEAGTVGTAFPGMEIKLLTEAGKDCPPGKMGVIYVRGEQVMKGYYNDAESTAKVLSDDGWLNTGDLGVMTHDYALAIVGRVKDTIVLSGGENIEPVPIEKRLCYSPFIDTAVVVGQDQKHLGALIIPDFAELEKHAKENNIPYKEKEDLVQSNVVRDLYKKEIQSVINHLHGFKSFEHIQNFVFLTKPFEVPRELSAKQELKRTEVTKLYAKEIAKIFK
ncbi:MAG TPA: AMP-binding protein [Treponemataceae bacterium]|nr:AMP-binding protein [Treponemataceae bacterium]